MPKLEGFQLNPRWGNLEKHIREALHINQLRRPLYAELSGGRTLPLARRLMRAQRLSLIFARVIDWFARRYQRAGIPIVTEDYVAMDLTPEFATRLPGTLPRLDQLVRPDVRRFIAEIRRIRRGGRPRLGDAQFAEAARAIEREIGRVREPAVFLCAYRHLLESMLRIATLGPLHDARARERGRSTRRFSWFLLTSHLPLLQQTIALDFAAAPLQAEGIPFLSQDFPPIDPRAGFYAPAGAGGAHDG